MAANLSIKITAEDAASKVFKQVESSTASLGGRLGGIAATAGAVGMTALAGGALAVAAGLGASVSAAADFEKQMSSIKAVSGATGAEMATLQGLALDLGKSTSFSASEAAAGIEELIKAGVSIGDVMGGGAAAALDLAAAGGVKVAEAAEIASNAMNQFGLKGADMAHVSNVIAGAANASAIDMTDFKFSLAAVGAVANAAGLDFDNTAVAIAELGQAGIKGSDAGTSLKSFIAGLTPSSETATKAMRELGLIASDGSNRFFDASGKLKSMAEIQNLLSSATGELTEQQRLMAFETIFGSDAIRAAAVLAKNGSAGYEEMAASMGKVTAQAVAAERLNNLAGDFEQLKGSLETAGITLGLALLPALRQLTQWATEGVNTLIPVLDTVGQAFAAWLGGFDLAGLSELGPVLMESFAAIGAVVLPALAELGGFLMEQLGVVIDWVRENWPLIRETFETVSNAVVAVVQTAWPVVRTVIAVALQAILGLVKLTMQVITGDWDGAWQTIQNGAFVVWNAIQGVISAALDAIGSAITTWATQTIVTPIAEGMDVIQTTVSAGWEAVQSACASLLAAIVTTIMTPWNALPEDIRADLVLIANHIVTQGAAWVTSLVTTGANMLTAIAAKLGEMVAAVETWATSTFLAPIQGLVGTATTEATNVGTGMWTSITGKLAEIVTAVTTWADSTFLAPIRGLVGTAQAEAQRIGQAIVDGIAGAISAGAGAIREAAYGAARSALDAAKGALGIESPSRVFNVEVGQQIVRGLMGGLDAMQGPLDRRLLGLVQPPSPQLAGAAGGFGPGGGATVVNHFHFHGAVIHERDAGDYIAEQLGNGIYRGAQIG